MDKNIDPFKDIFVVHSEHDHTDHMRSRGPIVLETYTGKADLPKAVQQGKRMSRYGKITICKLIPIGTLEECEEFINTPLDYKENHHGK